MIRARKRFGQHFLEPVWVEKVIKAIDPRPDQLFVEIGTGPARPDSSTGRARPVGHRLRDRSRSAAALGRTAREPEGRRGRLPVAEIVRLQTSTSPSSQPLPCAGNLPYNVASPIMFKLVELHAAGFRSSTRRSCSSAKSLTAWSRRPVRRVRRPEHPHRACGRRRDGSETPPEPSGRRPKSSRPW